MNTAVPFQAEKPIFRKLESIADVAMLTHDERVHYNISLNSFRTSLAVMEHQLNVGIEKGLVEGQKKKAIEIATKMLSKGFSISEIAEMTEMTFDEINRL